MNDDRRVAYFSMEIGLNSDIPTYSGGLGVLAGDTIRSAADLQVPLVAVTLMHREGYFYQKLDNTGWQEQEAVRWVIEDFLEPLDSRTSVTIGGRTVHLKVWKHEVVGCGGFKIPVYLLSSNLEENEEWDRTLTNRLYGGDKYYRLCQEVILGIGGARMLRQVGHDAIQRFHMNEGHAAFLTLELIEEELNAAGSAAGIPEAIEKVRQKCVFTTHTPVPAGHDQFPTDMVENVFGKSEVLEMKELCRWDDALNMTYLALNLSHYVNGVAKKHAEVSSSLFARYTIDSITNGVHAATWVAEPFCQLFDRYIAGWQADNSSLRYAESIPKLEVWSAHRGAKEKLMHEINRRHNVGFDVDIFTICFARRAATYKRADLFFHDMERLKNIAANVGPFQVIYAGKSHPQDQQGKELIQRIFLAADALKDHVKVVYLANYDMDLGRLLTSGSDLWLNTPQPPLEASGTSGMKAALNGVPSLSVLDGWWIEGCIEGITGWAIERDERTVRDPKDYGPDAGALYHKLENVILPMFYNDRERFIEVMRHCISINGSFFNTERMMHEYVLRAYFR